MSDGFERHKVAPLFELSDFPCFTWQLELPPTPGEQ